MDYHMFRRKYLFECLGKLGEDVKATVGNRVKPDYCFIRIVFVLFCYFQPDSCVLWQAMLKSMPAYIRHCGPKPG